MRTVGYAQLLELVGGVRIGIDVWMEAQGTLPEGCFHLSRRSIAANAQNPVWSASYQTSFGSQYETKSADTSYLQL